MGEKGPHGVEERFEEQDEGGIDGGDISAGHRVQVIGEPQLNDSQYQKGGKILSPWRPLEHEGYADYPGQDISQEQRPVRRVLFLTAEK